MGNYTTGINEKKSKSVSKATTSCFRAKNKKMLLQQKARRSFLRLSQLPAEGTRDAFLLGSPCVTRENFDRWLHLHARCFSRRVMPRLPSSSPNPERVERAMSCVQSHMTSGRRTYSLS
eukprot:scaffold710_cov171-Amphora_coffeaeformis.AAC.52